MPDGTRAWWVLGLLALVGLGCYVARRWWRVKRQRRVVASPPSLPPVPAQASSAARHSQLGPYRIDRPLGRGAMGTVYLAHELQSARPVALKTLALASEFEGAELVQARGRFFREAAMAGRLQHPDIVAIFDAGEAEGLAFIAMEYVSGHDLFRYTQPGRLLPANRVLYILARVARALAYAHRQGIVHRDVKPANVMIDAVAPAGTGTVKVTDFGIARLTDAHRTRTGVVLGTPSFMSPEQMAGGPIDGRTDLYALGVMLFQLLTGALPHAAESMGRLMHQIANEAAPDVRTLRPELPEALARVIARALEKRVEARYADGDQLAAELLSIAQTWPDPLQTPTGSESADPFRSSQNRGPGR